MGIFGWLYPPGCSSVPGDESEPVKLTHLVTLTGDTDGLYWDEDGNLIETFPVNVPADEHAGIPAYVEGGDRIVGRHDWDDELDEAANMAAAAAAYARMKVAA